MAKCELDVNQDLHKLFILEGRKQLGIITLVNNKRKIKSNIFISILGNLCPLNQMQLSKNSNWLYFLKYSKFPFFPKKIRKTAMSADF